VVLKFHDDPTVNESEIIIFLRQVLWAAGKRKGFERRREKNENERQRRLRSQSEKPSMLLFIARGIYDLLFTLFIFFIIFTKNS